MATSDDREATPEKRALFLALLSEYGNVSKSAEEANLNRTALYDYRAEHPEFAEAWERAAAIGTQALEDEARRRAYEGTTRPVFHRGVECGKIREYSDTLLIFLLKAHDPKYAETHKIEAINTNINANTDASMQPSEEFQAFVARLRGKDKQA